MSRGVALRSLATSMFVGLCVAVAVACVPQPPGRGTPPPVSTSAAPTARATPTPAPPTPSPSPSFSRPTATPQPTFFTYRVRSGDTITSIAKKHDTTVRSIGYWNRDKYPSLDPESSRYNPNDIRVGWVLLMIPGTEVEADDLTPPPTEPPPTEPPASEEPAD